MVRSLILLWLAGISVLCAQSSYHPLTNQTLPREVITSSTEKYRELVENMQKSGAKGKEKKVKRQFYLETSFMIDDLLQSGMVLFNDTLNQYLHRVMEQVLQGESRQLLEHIHFFVLRSPVVNAFAAPNGMVFVNLGLLARVENEAQLAFILSHELTHITHKHALSLYLDASGISEDSRSEELLSRSGYETSIVERKRYNRELELEADEKAIERMLQSGYDFSSLARVMDLLKYAGTPYENIPFFKSWLEDEYLIFPPAYFLNEVSEITGEDDASEEETSTHPSLGKRRNLIRSATGRADTTGKKQYLVSQQRFEDMQFRARMELPRLFLHKHLYQEAFYHAYMILLKDPENAYASRMMVQSLFLMASFLNSGDNEIAAERFQADDTEGEIQQVYHLFHKLSSEELTVVALSQAWKYHLAHPEDRQVFHMARELMTQLALEYKLGSGAFPATPPPAQDSTGLQPDDAPTHRKDSDGPGKKTGANPLNSNRDFHLYALGAWINSPEMTTAFQYADSLAGIRKKEQDHRASAEGHKEWSTFVRRSRSRGAKLGIEDVVVMNPYYLRIEEKDDESQVLFLASETGEQRFLKLIEENAERVDAKIRIIDPLLMQTSDTKAFNDMILLNEWMNEQLTYGSLPIPGQQQEKIDAIADAYGTDYFLWTGVISLKTKPTATTVCVGLCQSVFLWLFAPVIIYQSVTPQYNTIYYAVLFNVRTGAYREIKRVELPNNDTEGFLNLHLYDTFNQITHP